MFLGTRPRRRKLINDRPTPPWNFHRGNISFHIPKICPIITRFSQHHHLGPEDNAEPINGAGDEDDDMLVDVEICNSTKTVFDFSYDKFSQQLTLCCVFPTMKLSSESSWRQFVGSFFTIWAPRLVAGYCLSVSLWKLKAIKFSPQSGFSCNTVTNRSNFTREMFIGASESSGAVSGGCKLVILWSLLVLL